jgi:hypothetical protein
VTAGITASFCGSVDVHGSTAVDMMLEGSTGHASLLLAATKHLVYCIANLGKLGEPMGGNSENCQIK